MDDDKLNGRMADGWNDAAAGNLHSYPARFTSSRHADKEQRLQTHKISFYEMPKLLIPITKFCPTFNLPATNR